MGLATTPAELLLLFPQYLHSIEDFVNLSSSCRRPYYVLARTPPNTILYLASLSSRTFFRPHPHFLVAATAPQLSQWALKSPQNLSTLREAFCEGMDGLLSLCVSKTGLTMTDIRRLHSSRLSLINPVSDLIDHCAGKQWHEANDGRDNGMCFDDDPIDVEPERSLFQIIIYGELFGGTMDAILDSNATSGEGSGKFDLQTRLEYIRCCIPDQESGLTCNQVGLNQIVGNILWFKEWRKVRRRVGPDFKDRWRQTMWESAVQLHGWEGLRMLTPGGVGMWKERLVEIHERICTMEEGRRPKNHNGDGPVDLFYQRHRQYVTDAPCLAIEVRFCI